MCTGGEYRGVRMIGISSGLELPDWSIPRRLTFFSDQRRNY
jgi:hypothetical protein